MTDGTLRISATHFPVTTLGPGRRLGIWVQGCPLACGGCMSRHTWDSGGGREAQVAELLGLWREAVAAGADGLTLSGGEPLAQPAALAALLAGAATVRAEATAPGGVAAGRRPDFLVYTGYTEAELARNPEWQHAVWHADALVTGRYVAAAPTGLVWRGSANQRLTPRTGLGLDRYGPHLTRTGTAPALQVAETPDGILLLGVPRPGELAALGERMERAGTRLTGRSWEGGPS
jgi:anaerobic ribonucleoside-triphosphate reductase activating protein